MTNPESSVVTSLELYRQGARLEGKLDKLDDKLDGHSEHIVQLQHRADEQDRWTAHLKDELNGVKADLVKAADNKRQSISLWIAGLSLVVATIALFIMMAKTGVRP